MVSISSAGVDLKTRGIVYEEVELPDVTGIGPAAHQEYFRCAVWMGFNTREMPTPTFHPREAEVQIAELGHYSPTV
jgi:hypothetical protein